MTTLFTPLQCGAFALDHRVVMAPLTRMRADGTSNAARAINAEYYGQRASKGGLIIAEASQIVPGGSAAPRTPGIHSDKQIAGWKDVVDAVHAKGGIIVLQLWHVGRISHSSLQPGGALPGSASAVRAEGKVRTASGELADFETPRALTTAEVETLIEGYGQATRNAKAAGFDGVEIHGANGYLLEQFLQARTNKRTDAFGGAIENRARFLLSACRVAADVFGADRVGLRLSPFGRANDSGEDEPDALYTHVIDGAAALGLAYLHLIEPRASGAGQGEVDHQGGPSASELYRRRWPGVLIAAGNYNPAKAEAAVTEGHADAIAFGRYFISNPDLPQRIRKGRAFTPYNRKTFYVGEHEGYTDYGPFAA